MLEVSEEISKKVWKWDREEWKEEEIALISCTLTLHYSFIVGSHLVTFHMSCTVFVKFSYAFFTRVRSFPLLPSFWNYYWSCMTFRPLAGPLPLSSFAILSVKLNVMSVIRPRHVSSPQRYRVASVCSEARLSAEETWPVSPLVSWIEPIITTARWWSWYVRRKFYSIFSPGSEVSPSLPLLGDEAEASDESSTRYSLSVPEGE